MGNNESTPAAEGENVSTAIIRLKIAKSKGEITQEEYDAGKASILATHTQEIVFFVKSTR
jgi:hypothetical protein